MTATALKPGDFKVADLSLAEYGRNEIRLAEHEMPGLMALREEFGAEPAARRRPHRRLAAHDRADRRPDRDPRRARRRRALGLLQHLLHPGPRRRRGRRRHGRHRRRARRHAGLRLEGRDAAGVLVVHRADADLAGRHGPEHAPRRRRRRHAADPQGHRVREGRRGADRRRGGLRGVRRHPRPAARLGRRRPARSSRGWARASRASPRRRPPVCTGSTSSPRPASCSSPRSTSTTPSPSRSSTTSTAPATR